LELHFPLIKQHYGKGIISPENRVQGNGVDMFRKAERTDWTGRKIGKENE
jgi:hypothetical protein